MPKGLVRYQHTGNFHFVTFSCYKREPLFAERSGYGIFAEELEKVRQRHGFVVAGYVVMPEHVHLLVSEPRNLQLSTILQVLKQQVSRKLKRPGDRRFWQRRYDDFNVWNHDKTVEKLKYMHRNPVRRGLAARPQDWRWSSFRYYLTGEDGTVEIESDWTARKREHHEASTPPTLPNTGER
jgi:putative transposase